MNAFFNLPARLFCVWCFAFQVIPHRAVAADTPLSPGEGKGTFWIIPHTHWEGAVFKTREEYLEMGLPHILTALRLLKENPNYRFVLDQVTYFKPFLERYPEEAESFRKFVSDGRLQIVCGLNVMPDDNMPSGESFIRQMLYAKGYCRDALGVEVKVGWLLDTFGHHAQMPQLLRRAGYNSFWFFRGVEKREEMSSEFIWEGLDGTRIPAFWLPFAYGHLYGPPRDLPGFTNFMKERYNALAPFSRAKDRVGLAGVDVSEPELYVPALVEKFNQQPGMPFVLKIGVPTDFEAQTAKRSDLPVVKGERNPLFQGIYSSRIELKQWMRTIERLATTSEKLGALSALLGTPQDNKMTLRAWEPALFNVTHDLASGVMTDDVYADTLRGYEFSRRLADEMIETRVAAISRNLDTQGEGIPLVVFNMLGWSRTDVAHGDVGFAEGGVVDFDLFNEAGKTVPAQVDAIERFDDGGLRRVKFDFIASAVPALGHAVYHVVARKSSGQLKTTVPNPDGAVLENEFYQATVDPKTGTLRNLRVKSGDWEALSGGGNVLAREKDNGDFWELYKNLDGFQNVMMTRPLKVPERGKAQFSDEFTGTNGITAKGPVFSEFRVTHALGTNLFFTRLRMYAGIPRIEFQTRILNREPHVRYRVLFPTSIRDGRGVHEIPFGAVERPPSQEYPAQNWIDYSDAHRGVSLLNRANPGNNISEGTLMLSLMRSTSIRSYGIGGGFEGQGSDSGLELGKELTFDYALLPHDGDWRDAGTYRAALDFNNPLITRKAAAHTGKLPKRWGLIDLDPPNVVLSAFKHSEQDGAIIRVYEAAGKATSGATLKLNATVDSAWEANLMEDSGSKLESPGDTIRFDLHPFEIKTLKIKFRN
jgi:alpha-mannosidase